MCTVRKQWDLPVSSLYQKQKVKCVASADLSSSSEPDLRRSHKFKVMVEVFYFVWPLLSRSPSPAFLLDLYLLERKWCIAEISHSDLRPLTFLGCCWRRFLPRCGVSEGSAIMMLCLYWTLSSIQAARSHPCESNPSRSSFKGTHQIETFDLSFPQCCSSPASDTICVSSHLPRGSDVGISAIDFTLLWFYKPRDYFLMLRYRGLDLPR